MKERTISVKVSEKTNARLDEILRLRRVGSPGKRTRKVDLLREYIEDGITRDPFGRGLTPRVSPPSRGERRNR